MKIHKKIFTGIPINVTFSFEPRPRGRTFTSEYDPNNLPIQLRVENSRSGGISKFVMSALNSHKIKVLHKLMTFHFLNC